MKRYLPLLLLLNSWQKPVIAVPVVPNFSSGSMSAVTRTTQNITENIVSTDYNTGHSLSITGANLEIDGSTLLPDPTIQQQCQMYQSRIQGPPFNFKCHTKEVDLPI
jgi:hypothetical protein